MSRSRKKHAVVKDRASKGMKRVANKKVRKYLKDFRNHLKKSSYKKIFQSWNIHDYWEMGTSFETFYLRQRLRSRTPMSREEAWKYYHKHYLGK